MSFTTHTRAEHVVSVVASVPEDAEGQKQLEKRSQTVPAPLDNGNGELTFSINHNTVFTVVHAEKHFSRKCVLKAVESWILFKHCFSTFSCM